MSIRAYIRKDFSMIDNEGIKWYRKEFELCYNTRLQQNITELLIQYGASDYRNEDGLGAIEISRYKFMNLFNNRLLLLNRDDRKSLMRLKEYFESDYYKNRMLGYVKLECF